MSLTLVQSWINKSFQSLPAAVDAMAFFAKAEREGKVATLMAPPELMSDGKCRLAHWTGYELVVVELSPEQQQAFDIEPQALHMSTLPARNEKPIRLVNLTDVQFDGGLYYDQMKPLAGACTYEFADAMRRRGLRCALRIKCSIPRSKYAISVVDKYSVIAPPRGDLTFSFNSLASWPKFDVRSGPVLFYCQLVALSRRGRKTVVQPVSNLLVRMIEVEELHSMSLKPSGSRRIPWTTKRDF